MKPDISVIICTHNPKREYLDKVLRALQFQTLSTEFWELLLIDNASNQILESEINLGWHSQSRHIREEKLGLTPTRLRGIQEAAGEILIFVDDDNVLEPDYLEVTLQIAKDFPMLGAWGGQIKPEFEEPPPEWTKPYWQFLCIREFEQDKWSNLLHQHETTPCGAGLCVRRIVANQYVELVRKDSKRAELDRKGKLLTSGGDTDLAFTACDMGLGTGQFTALKMIHIIPANRLQEDYLVRLMEGLQYSGIILEYFRGKLPSQPSWRKSKIYKYLSTLYPLYQLYVRFQLGARKYRFYQAGKRGAEKAIQEITHLVSSN